MIYYENCRLKKYRSLFNYSNLIKDIIRIKKKYQNEYGNSHSEKQLISILKSLEKVYVTNNICETIHSKLSKFLGNKPITKNLFRDTLNYVFNNYAFNNKKIVRKDYITRTIIIIIEKYELNNKPKFITYNEFKKELENTVCIMTGKIKTNSVNELINSLENLTEDENNILLLRKY